MQTVEIIIDTDMLTVLTSRSDISEATIEILCESVHSVTKLKDYEVDEIIDSLTWNEENSNAVIDLLYMFQQLDYSCINDLTA